MIRVVESRPFCPACRELLSVEAGRSLSEYRLHVDDCVQLTLCLLRAERDQLRLALSRLQGGAALGDLLQEAARCREKAAEFDRLLAQAQAQEAPDGPAAEVSVEAILDRLAEAEGLRHRLEEVREGCRRLHRRCQKAESRALRWRRRYVGAFHVAQAWQKVVRKTNRVIRLYLDRWHATYYRSCGWCRLKWWIVRTLTGRAPLG